MKQYFNNLGIPLPEKENEELNLLVNILIACHADMINTLLNATSQAKGIFDEEKHSRERYEEGKETVGSMINSLKYSQNALSTIEYTIFFDAISQNFLKMGKEFLDHINKKN